MITNVVAQAGPVPDCDIARTRPCHPSGEYYFAKHLFCCIEGRHAVLLDLKRDKYLCLPRARLDACGHMLSGWPVPQHEAQPLSSPPDNEVQTTIGSMLQQGMLTMRATDGRRAEPTSHTPPITSLAPTADHTSRGGYILRHFFNFAVATTLASSFLRWRHLEKVVNAVARRRANHMGVRDGVELDACRELVTLFQAMRPLFPSKYLCLLDSLALLGFLSRYDQFPRWVFGVRMDPFNAHCWVQASDVVLNDTVEHARSYTPIMVV